MNQTFLSETSKISPFSGIDKSEIFRRMNQTDPRPTPTDVLGAADINEANGTSSDSKQTLGLRRSGEAGNSGRKPLKDVEQIQ